MYSSIFKFDPFFKLRMFKKHFIIFFITIKKVQHKGVQSYTMLPCISKFHQVLHEEVR